MLDHTYYTSDLVLVKFFLFTKMPQNYFFMTQEKKRSTSFTMLINKKMICYSVSYYEICFSRFFNSLHKKQNNISDLRSLYVIFIIKKFKSQK